ncbi:type II toxin-antitoxin system VapB family antitoxin [Actinomycetospora cinnamomea]|uniref:type II toxin-antitoxin system VapB family antitoxin n=1 Tax=Actinomycetospora cinnamomea TaxID=663609 RepID=UPI000E3143CF|nr:type II toxin-antitoxin system VapB family antitoxin [Actinomycetospora cinnamomea]
MALDIKNAATDRLARELAAATGETITEALRLAVESGWPGFGSAGARTSSSTRWRRSCVADARATLDERPSEEILGYGPDGLPA